jgi:hypothetical protein
MAFVNGSERLIALLPKLDDIRDLNDVLKSEGINILATLGVERLVKILFGLDCFDLGVLLKDDENEAGAFLSNHSERLVRILSNLRLPDLRVLLKAEKHHSCPSARNEIGNVAPFPFLGIPIVRMTLVKFASARVRILCHSFVTDNRFIFHVMFVIHSRGGPIRPRKPQSQVFVKELIEFPAANETISALNPRPGHFEILMTWPLACPESS